jgi:hypothetical protein
MKRTIFAGAVVLVVLIAAGPAHAACHSASFDPSTYQVREGAGTVELTVENPGPRPDDRTVDYETVNGTARAGSDYVAKSGTLSFTLTDTRKTISIAITNDSAVEGAETFQVRLRARDGSCITDLGGPATVTIADEDRAPEPTQTASPTSPSPTTTSPSPTAPGTATATPAAPDEDDGGLGGGAVAGIVGGAVAVGGAATYFIRRRLLS